MTETLPSAQALHDRLAKVKSDLEVLETRISTTIGRFKEAKATLASAQESKDAEKISEAKRTLDLIDKEKNDLKQQRYLRWSDEREINAAIAELPAPPAAVESSA